MTAAPQAFNHVPKRNHLGRYWTSHFVKPKQTTTRILFTTTPAPPYRESHLSTILRPADGRRLICRRASWDSHRSIGLLETSDKLLLIPTTVTAPSKNQGTLRSMTVRVGDSWLLPRIEIVDLSAPLNLAIDPRAMAAPQSQSLDSLDKRPLFWPAESYPV